ncbi:MAG: alkene reductase [Pseudobdellovibrionaceae bacterium]
MSNLFEPFVLGRITLKNRVVMAPMTRSRATQNLANDLIAKYYGLRANAGLIITEGISPSPNGLGYPRIPGLFNWEQVQSWKKVTETVHKNGGKIFAQFMHTGRVSHTSNLPSGAKVQAPSAIALPGEMWTDAEGPKPHTAPTEMTEADIQNAISEFAQAAKNAVEAGFDGIEIHGANGYLVDQFINVASNHRKDQWGGSIENRIRFPLAVAKACADAIGADRVGIRLSPYGVFNGMTPDPQMDELYVLLSKKLSEMGLAYIHIVDHSSMGAPPVSAQLKAKIREAFKGPYILSGGYDNERAQADLKEGKGDLVAFGRPYISNPDLVEKLRTGKSLTIPDHNTFYTPGEKGYTDY